MKYIHQVLLILLFSFLGELLHAVIPWPIPASIYGMVLMFAALSLKIVKPESVRDAGGFFVSILPLLFVTPIVGLMDRWDMIRDNLVAIVVIMLVSTVLCFMVTGMVTQLLMNRKNKKEGR